MIHSGARIRNLEQLCLQGLTGLRRDALRIAQAGLAACDGAAATREAVSRTPTGLMVSGTEYPLAEDQRLYVLGAGKATLAIAEALEEVLGDRIDQGLIALRHGESAELSRIEVLRADHPLPSRDSVTAGRRLLEIADQTRKGDLVITCVTGGRSALVSAPPDGIDFTEKRRLTERLLRSGMPIAEINTVRKHLSSIKGGRLAARIAPGRIVNLAVSDVAGDRLDVLADLTTQDHSSPADAIGILRRHGLLEDLPEPFVAHLESRAALSPDLDGIEIDTVMLVNGKSVCDAMAGVARSVGLEPVTVSTTLEGEAAETGQLIARLASHGPDGGDPYPPGTALVGCGGESTVTLGDATLSLGGPNQEAAIAAALALDGRPVAAAFLDSDGSDGSTEAAGAICDGETARRAREAGIDLNAALDLHASTEPLKALGDLIETGPTGTNVNDLFVAAVGNQEERPDSRYGGSR